MFRRANTATLALEMKLISKFLFELTDVVELMVDLYEACGNHIAYQYAGAFPVEPLPCTASLQAAVTPGS